MLVFTSVEVFAIFSRRLHQVEATGANCYSFQLVTICENYVRCIISVNCYHYHLAYSYKMISLKKVIMLFVYLPIFSFISLLL